MIDFEYSISFHTIIRREQTSLEHKHQINIKRREGKKKKKSCQGEKEERT